MPDSATVVARAASTSLSTLDDAGELPWHLRRDLHVVVGAELGDASHQIREFYLELGTLCAQRVWGVWLSEFGDDLQPMNVAKACIARGRSGTAFAVEEFRSLGADLDDKLLLGERSLAAVYAGYSWWAVARDALAPETPSGQLVSELEIAPDEWSACFLASLAAAGGASWESVADNSQRRAFWEWYLNEAVPSAFDCAAKT